MCGISGIIGPNADISRILRMMSAQRHRGPDAEGFWESPYAAVILGHNRLSIIDTRAVANQPMMDESGRYAVVLNGEIYNYRELREELAGYPFKTTSDTEVLLAAFCRWGTSCLDRLTGMFAFLLWDEQEKVLIAVRDRFGVKPLYYAVDGDTVFLASEIKALHAGGIPVEYDEAVWAAWLRTGIQDYPDRTFWQHIAPVPAGHMLVLRNQMVSLHRWYDFVIETGQELDTRSDEVVADEYLSLLKRSVSLRYRSDVSVGLAISGGLDSSTLLAVIHAANESSASVTAYTFTCGDADYDELPWVRAMIEQTPHPLKEVRLHPEDVPGLAASVMAIADEPYGGIPTLAYAKLFEQARHDGTVVLLDGQGMDEQWAGYDYYASKGLQRLVQGATDSPIRPDCMSREFHALADLGMVIPEPWIDDLRNMQYRDLFWKKLPRALRYNDRASMRASTELREPFLDHQVVACAFSQPENRKLRDGQRKAFLRQLVVELLPVGIVEAPKRAVQTPQREWLRGPLKEWVHDMVDTGMRAHATWLDCNRVLAELDRFDKGYSDNSYYVWQWITLGLLATTKWNICQKG